MKIDGVSFGGGVIKSMKLVKESEQLPVKGIVRSTLFVTLKTDLVFAPNAEISVKIGDMYFAPHYVSRISRRGDLLSIEAEDLMRRLENPFDDSLYNEGDQPFTASLLLAELARQCGFKKCENLPADFGKFYYGDIHSRTCREILNLVSEYAVGTFSCTNDCSLRFDKFLSYTKAVGVNWNDSARIYFHSVKGPFKAVYGKNTATGEIHKAGDSMGGGSFTNVLKLTGRLLDKKRIGEIMSEIINKSFQAYYCDHMDIMAVPDGLTAFITESGGELVSVRTEIIFGGSCIYCRAKAADICEDESDYLDLRDHEIRKRIEEYRQYGSVIMTEKGLGVVSEDDTNEDIREKQALFFSKASESVSCFEGAILDRKMPDKIEKISDNCRRIVYGKNSYLLKFVKGEDGSKSEISLEKEEEKE
ncbi:MAG: hypothetical protein K2K57_01440 [Oscillospiraceae bacterium]|nr:hypothetical protein [Oscillospiraceae bacterium]